MLYSKSSRPVIKGRCHSILMLLALVLILSIFRLRQAEGGPLEEKKVVIDLHTQLIRTSLQSKLGEGTFVLEYYFLRLNVYRESFEVQKVPF